MDLILNTTALTSCPMLLSKVFSSLETVHATFCARDIECSSYKSKLREDLFSLFVEVASQNKSFFHFLGHQYCSSFGSRRGFFCSGRSSCVISSVTFSRDPWQYNGLSTRWKVHQEAELLIRTYRSACITYRNAFPSRSEQRVDRGSRRNNNV